MNATINELWETGRNIICFDNSEFERPGTFADLKKCDNVLIGDSVEGSKIKEVLIDNEVVLVNPTRTTHPMGGTMFILEVL